MTVSWIGEGKALYAEAGGRNWKGVPVWTDKPFPSVNEYELYVKTGETPDGDWEFKRIDEGRTFSLENLARRVVFEIEGI
jgi:hypothetical protein